VQKFGGIYEHVECAGKLSSFLKSMSWCACLTDRASDPLLHAAESVRFCFLNTKHVLNNEALAIRDNVVFSHDSSRNPTTTYIIDSVVDSRRKQTTVRILSFVELH